MRGFLKYIVSGIICITLVVGCFYLVTLNPSVKKVAEATSSSVILNEMKTMVEKGFLRGLKNRRGRGEGLIVYYREESFWIGDGFSRILNVETEFSSNPIKILLQPCQPMERKWLALGLNLIQRRVQQF